MPLHLWLHLGTMPLHLGLHLGTMPLHLGLHLGTLPLHLGIPLACILLLAQVRTDDLIACQTTLAKLKLERDWRCIHAKLWQEFDAFLLPADRAAEKRAVMAAIRDERAKLLMQLMDDLNRFIGVPPPQLKRLMDS